ncbi:MAG: thiamine diphosphokinase [Candidatus Berkiellales bacterium]
MYDALIILNGEIPSPKYWRHFKYRTLICTDGAALPLKEMGITPNIIIGDMDSISDGTQIATVETLKKKFPSSQIFEFAEQDTTDFEKVLQFAQDNQLHNILCMGVLGKAADHSIYNLCLLYRFSKSLKLLVFHHYEELGQWIFVLPAKCQIQAPTESHISFFPLPEATLFTQGLKWELNRSILSTLGHTSMRNRTVRESINIECLGACLCFLTCSTTPIIQEL